MAACLNKSFQTNWQTNPSTTHTRNSEPPHKQNTKLINNEQTIDSKVPNELIWQTPNTQLELYEQTLWTPNRQTITRQWTHEWINPWNTNGETRNRRIDRHFQTDLQNFAKTWQINWQTSWKSNDMRIDNAWHVNRQLIKIALPQAYNEWQSYNKRIDNFATHNLTNTRHTKWYI